MILNRGGQIAIYVIIAIVIVAGIVAVVVLRGNVGGGTGRPEELKPVFDAYIGCIEEQTKAALDLVGTQGGRVYLDDYIPGSEYAPFSNQLNFLGFGVPYWYYLSGNGVVKENIPSKGEMEKDVARYVEENLRNCNLERFYEQGYEINIGEIKDVKVSIGDTSASIEVDSELSVSKGNSSATDSASKIVVQSKIGKFYNLARQIYDKEKNEAFLENYSVDVLRLYAPVDGVEIQCSSKIWKTREVTGDLKKGLEANIGKLKLQGSYYKLQDEKNKYFVINQKTDESVNFIYSPSWPTKIEIAGDGIDDELMTANPVGQQEGLGILGFCYVPYHFVYDLSYPVMIQIYNGEEIFQFPVAVVIDNNVPRKAEGAGADYLGQENFDLCAFKNQEVEISLYDTNLNKIDGSVYYECFDQRCRLGETKNGKFVGEIPSCVNGFLKVKAENYSDARQLFSSNSEKAADVILSRQYEVDVSVKVDGKEVNDGTAVVYFGGQKDTKSASAVLPGQSKIKLTEGGYDLLVYIYSNTSVVIPASKKTQCQELPESGILGIFGSTKEKCFDIDIPETKIEYGLSGGGKSNTYLLESELAKGKVTVEVHGLGKPETLEQLQNNFAAFDSQGVSLEFG